MEAELDYFGAHSYDLKSEGAGEVKKGESSVSIDVRAQGDSRWVGRTTPL